METFSGFFFPHLFSKFTSSYSGFSTAAAAVLKRFTRNNNSSFFYSRNLALKVAPAPMRLHWPTFIPAVHGTGEPHLYDGIHFYEENAVGLEVDEKAGNHAAYARVQSLRSGAWAERPPRYRVGTISARRPGEYPEAS